MMFHSWIFLPFFFGTYLVYLALKNTRFRNLWLLGVSYIFYGWWDLRFVLIIGYASCFDYLMLLLIDKLKGKKVWLVLSILNSVVLLSFFKYAGFLTENINILLTRLGAGFTLEAPDMFFPIGISFYLFKSIGYVVDCYRGQVQRERNFINHALFVSFFPILILGPIERAKNLLPQLRSRPQITPEDMAEGLSLFVVGLFKKIALADYLAIYVDRVYGMPGEYQSGALMLATFAFAWQIYFDFSGYTDMARGLSRMMSIRITLNFNNPYLATGLGDFWHRWHISLSSWFRDYVYIPLGGSRKGRFNTYRNLFLTFVIAGLWHGAGWTFIVWGAFHGLGLILTRDWERSRFYQDKIPKILKQLWVFIFVCLGWIFFRAENINEALLIISRIFSSGWADAGFPLLLFFFILLAWLYQYIYESRVRYVLTPAAVRITIFILMILYLAICTGSVGQAFIYQQF